MTAIEEAKSRHWKELSDTAAQILGFWGEDAEHPHYVGSKDCIVDDGQLESIDGIIALNLLVHLKAEFGEFADIARWQDLLFPGHDKAVEKLVIAAKRRTFEGKCDICKSYFTEAPAPAPALSTTEAVSAFLESHKAKGSSPHTIEHYCSCLNKLSAKFKELPTEPEPIEDFLSQWQGSTRRDYFKLIRNLYRFLNKRHGIANPTDKMDLPKVKGKIVASLSSDELRRLCEVAKSSKRDNAILLLLSGSGIRVGEASNLKFGDIGEDTLKVDGKTGGRVVPLFPQVRDALLALKNGHGASDSVFWGEHPHQPLGIAGFQRVVKKSFTEAGITGKRASPHTLRHSFGRNWITQGGDTVSLKAILGHASLEMTQKYANLAIEDLQGKNSRHNPLLCLSSLSQSDGSITSPDRSISPLDNGLSR